MAVAPPPYQCVVLDAIFVPAHLESLNVRHMNRLDITKGLLYGVSNRGPCCQQKAEIF